MDNLNDNEDVILCTRSGKRIVHLPTHYGRHAEEPRPKEKADYKVRGKNSDPAQEAPKCWIYPDVEDAISSSFSIYHNLTADHHLHK
jgi:hypothetical protein